MPELLEDQPTKEFDLAVYLDIIRRRHVVFLAVLLAGWFLVWGSSWVLPPRYKSTTLILVQQPTMPQNYVIPNVNDNLQDRLQTITQQILSRTRLLLIINRLHLFPDTGHATSPDDKVARMRKAIDIELVRDPGNDSIINAFKVSYSAGDPHLAQKVDRELTSLFIDENLRIRQQESEGTTRFLQDQLQNARIALADQETKVRAFEAAHEGELPAQQASNLEILRGLQEQLQTEEDSLNAARQQRAYYQSLIQQYRALQTPLHTAGGAPTGLAGLDQELEKLRAQLTDLRTRYTDQYPDVQRVRQEIAETERTRATLVAELKKKASSESSGGDSATQELVDPGQNAALLQLQSQADSNRMEIANREQAIANLKTRIAKYEGLLSAVPGSAQELAELTRGYEQSQANYNDLLKKESDSQMATSMEQMQEGERFTMLDPPSLPLKPDFPNRLKMCGAGIGAGLGLAVALVALLEFFDDRLYTEQQIKDLLPMGVIAEVPEIISIEDEQHEKRKLFAGWVMAAAVLLIILVGSAFSYLHA